MTKIKSLATIMLCLSLQTVEAKVALLIGNDAYKNEFLPVLDKAVSDAERLRDKLTRLGFKVIFKKDLNAKEMRDAFREFHDALKKDNEVGLFYYAGHGMQVSGNNYLIPINAKIEREYEVKAEGINADLLLNAMFEAKTKINLVILDACRNNAFATRGGTRGLAAITREDTFVVFATQPNKVAEDGTFMDYLSMRITEPLAIDQMIKKVRNDVRDKTEGAQVPSYNNNLAFDFYFNGKPNITTPLAVIEPKKVVKPPKLSTSQVFFNQGLPLNVEGDADKDGILDSKDKCPRTPLEATINSFGCWVLEGVLFDTNEYYIKPKYYYILNVVTNILKKNPGLTIEVQGHTDSVGSDSLNRRLSQNRANSVKKYLVRNANGQISLTARGYGETRPVASNSTEEGRATNRRVQLDVIDISH